jgi:hypothetical protein
MERPAGFDERPTRQSDARSRRSEQYVGGDGLTPGTHKRAETGDRRDGKEVNRDEVARVILEERAPRLRRWSPAAWHVFADTGLRDINAEHEQFAMDSWRSPTRIFAAHLVNQISNLFENGLGPGALVILLPRK